MSVEAMKQALEALVGYELVYGSDEKDREAITSLRQAIEAAEKQEPVAWMIWLYGLAGLFEHKQLAELEFSRRNEEYPNKERKLVPLYTQPQQQPVNLVAYNCKCGRTMKFESVNGIVAPQREWIGLTDEEMQECIKTADYNQGQYKRTPYWAHLSTAIEAKLKEKNT